MRISDWSSDVCSSDLLQHLAGVLGRWHTDPGPGQQNRGGAAIASPDRRAPGAGQRMSRAIELRILDSRIGGAFALPDYATAAAAGIDLRAMPEHRIPLAAGDTQLQTTGLAIPLAETQ